MSDGQGSLHKRNSSRGPISLRTTASPPASSHRRARSIPLFSAGAADDEDAIDGFRTVRVNNFPVNLRKGFVSNELRTAKYTPLNMIPKSLFEQL